MSFSISDWTAILSGRLHQFSTLDMSSWSRSIGNFFNSSGQDATTTKENDGSSPYQRQRKFVRIVAWLGLAVFMYQILVSHFLAGMVPDIEIDKVTGQKKIRRRPERMKKMGPDGKMVPRTPLDGIVEGHFHLIDIEIPQGALTENRYNVQGTFCAIQWTKQQQDPSSVPLFEDLITSSELCAVTTHTADLYDVAQKAHQWDLHMRNATLTRDIWKRQQQKHIPQPEAQPIQRSISPTLLVFHESRCGSTLVSNLLASFDPEMAKVYSEAGPPIKALEACSMENCPTPLTHKKLIRDVFYLMGRTQRGLNPEQHVFYRLQARAVHYIPLLESALPEPVPWLYLYRDNIHVMMSHFKGSVIDPKTEEVDLLGFKKPPKCLESYQALEQPEALKELVVEQGRTVNSLSAEEYCAAYLASLSESAIQHYQTEQERSVQHQKTPHFFVNYKQLPDVVWDHILPGIGVSLTARDIQRMEKVAAVYTQGRMSVTDKKVFTGDSVHKESDVPVAIEKASQIFMDPTFAKLEALASATLKSPKKVEQKEERPKQEMEKEDESN